MIVAQDKNPFNELPSRIKQKTKDSDNWNILQTNCCRHFVCNGHSITCYDALLYLLKWKIYVISKHSLFVTIIICEFITYQEWNQY